jgi:hypothetical protein
MEPTNSSDSSVTMLALIVGGLLVAVVLLFGFGGGFNATPREDKTTISIDTPAPKPAPATTPSND